MIERLVSIRYRRGRPGYTRLARTLRDAETRESLTAEVRASSTGAALIHTCERVELIAECASPRALRTIVERSAGAPPTTETTGPAALREICRVAAGLDSRLIGEGHIQGQVRAALRAMLAARHGTPLLTRSLGEAIRIGRLVRTQTPLGGSRHDFGPVAAERLSHELNGLSGTPIAVIGSGVVAREAAVALSELGADQGVVVARHADRTEETAAVTGFAAAPLADLPAVLGRVAGVIAATASPRALVAPEHLPEAPTLTAIDLGEPANIDPLVAALPGVTVFTMDDLAGGVPVRAEAAALAESIVESEVSALAASMLQRVRGHAG